MSRLLGLILLGICLAQPARAGLYFEFTGFPEYTNTTDSANGATSPIGGSTQGPINTLSGFSYDTRIAFGYTFFNSQFLIGGSFNYSYTPLNQSAYSGNGSEHETWIQSDYGPTIGWLPGNFRFLVTYLFAGRRTYNFVLNNGDGSIGSEQQTQDDNGSGWQVVVGYSFPVTSWFRVGPTLVYRTMTYKNQTFNDAVNPGSDSENQPLASPAISAELEPMISLIISF